MELSDYMIDLFKLAYMQDSIKTDYLIIRQLQCMRNDLKNLEIEIKHSEKLFDQYQSNARGQGLARAREKIKKYEFDIRLLDSTLTSLRLK